MIRTIPGKRCLNQRDPGEFIIYDHLNALARPRAVIEPETVGLGPLDEPSAAAILATATAGIVSGFTKSGTETVNANSSLIFSDQIFVPNAITGMVVIPEQKDGRVLLSGRIVIEPTSDGSDPIPRLIIRGHNLTGTNESITDGTTFGFACVLRDPIPRAITPNAELIITPGKTWTPGEPILPEGLNAMALPSAVYRDASIGKVELNSRDMATLAARYVGKRGTFTTAGSPTNVPAGTTVTLGTPAVAGAVVGDPVLIGSTVNVPCLFTGHVASAGFVSVKARGCSLSTVVIPASTLLNIIVIH